MSHTNSVRKKTQCSFCKGVGHNRRGCEYASLAACLAPEIPEIIDLRSPVKKRCSYCGLMGHNIRTCAGNNWTQIRRAAAITIQKYARRLLVYQTIEFPVDPYLGSDPVSRRKPRILPETRGVESTPVESLKGSRSVSWMPGTISPVPSIQRLHQQARANSISLIEEFEECESPLVLP